MRQGWKTIMSVATSSIVAAVLVEPQRIAGGPSSRPSWIIAAISSCRRFSVEGLAMTHPVSCPPSKRRWSGSRSADCSATPPTTRKNITDDAAKSGALAKRSFRLTRERIPSSRRAANTVARCGPTFPRTNTDDDGTPKASSAASNADSLPTYAPAPTKHVPPNAGCWSLPII